MRVVVETLLVIVLATGAVASESSDALQERNKWRVSVGASLIGPVRSNLGVNNARMRQLSGFETSFSQNVALPRGGRSRAEAYAAGSGAADPNGVMKFDGEAWYNPVDASSANDPGWSWNWRLHDPTEVDHDGLKGFVERTAYSEVFESVTCGCGGDSSEWLPGLRVELSRELYYSEGECPWGFDIAAAFAYYFQQNFWKTGGTAARREEGYYEWWNDSGDTAQYILDYERATQFRDGMWGAGTFGGPGAELETAAWRVRDVVTASESGAPSHSLSYRGDGDYREYSIELIARPWWEPWNWLRLFASLGMGVSRREFEWSISAVGSDGSAYRESGDAGDWMVHGLLGGGVSVQWYDFFITGEALWRFGGDDLEVSGRVVHGNIEHGDWGLRLSLGYEF